MVSKKVTIECLKGLHMLPAIRLNERVDICYGCSVTLRCPEADINVKDILDVMAHCKYLKCGTEVEVICDGQKEQEHLDMVVRFLEKELLEFPFK